MLTARLLVYKKKKKSICTWGGLGIFSQAFFSLRPTGGHVRRNSKNSKDPFTHTNLATLIGSIGPASRVMGVFLPGEKYLKGPKNISGDDPSFVVNFPAYARKTEDDF